VGEGSVWQEICIFQGVCWRGDVVVHSGHTLNPWIRALVSRGCMLHSVGDILDFMLCSKSLVYSSIGSSLIAAMPLRTCQVNFLVQLSLRRVWRGS